jgi:neutral/alkaline ceramidase-like enzyme
VTLRALALLLCLACPVVVQAEGRARPPAPAAPPEPLRAGAAMVPLRVPMGTPLAGYGSFRRRLPVPDLLGLHPHAFWFRPGEGELDAPAGRALVLETATARLTWVTVDLIAVDRAFVDALRQRLEDAGSRPGALVVSASHTHSGPGAFLDSWLMGILAADRFDGEVLRAILDSVVEAVQRAETGRAPARVGAARVDAALTASRLDQPVDSELVVLKVASPAGAPIALLWNYAIHGTMLGSRNLKYSGDVMGVASRELERRFRVPALFVNGAVGDVSPRHHGPAAAVADGRTLAAAAEEAWAQATPESVGALVIRTARVPLPPPSVSLRNCIRRWVPRALTLPLGRLLPRDTELVAGTLGGTAWVTIPGELQARLGRTLKEAGQAAGVRAFVAGVSNDYLGYFLTPEDYDRTAYVACASLYGPEGGARLTRAASELLEGLAAEDQR